MWWRHLVVGLSILVCVVLTAFGVVGPAAGPERIERFDVVATVNPDRTVSVREVIDWDFGIALDTHGIFRDIPTDAGVPQQVRVWSPGAPDATLASRKGTDAFIRIGDAATLVRGRQRYVITYVLPELVEGDTFFLDAIGTGWPVPVEDATVTIRGAQLDEPRCFVGPDGSDERCPLEEGDGTYRTHLDHLDAHEAVSIEGTLLAPPAPEGGPVVDEVSSAAAGQPLPPFTPRDPDLAARWAAIVAALGTLVAVAAYGWSRQTGRNEVAVGGATEAAFAEVGPTGAAGGGRTRLVADADMHELAGLSFTPPPIEPWQGAVVLREEIGPATTGAWFSSQAARDVVVFHNTGGTVVMAPGPEARSADAETAAVLNTALGGRGSVTLGQYDPAFSSAWTKVGGIISTWASSSGTFRRRPPGQGSGGGQAVGIAVGLGSLVVVPLALALGFTVGFQVPFAAVALAVVVPGFVALGLYRRLVRSLSAKGSALHLQTESFRRFLHESEAQHVDWAWRNGLLREYSAWAVALGESRAWGRALEGSGVPPSETTVTDSILAPSVASSSFSSSHTAPSSSSDGGGGGGSGGGGGGGGGGSW